jgi:ribokinase
MVSPERRGVVVVGSLNRDYVIEVQARPSPGETVLGAKVTEGPGGKGANQAAAAARTGAAVSLIGRVGDDGAGVDLTASLRHAGVETETVIVTRSASTGSAFITVTPDGENSIIVASGANALLGSADVAAGGALLAAAGVLLLQLEVQDEALEAAAQLVGPETVVVLNASPYRELSRTIMERVDVLLINALEARQLLGDAGRLDDATAFDGLGPRFTVVTLGAAGARAYIDGRILACNAAHADVVDTTGAGDAFAGALGAWLAKEAVDRSADLVEPIRRALPAASAAAAYSVSRPGAQSSYGSAEDLGPPWTRAAPPL